MTTGEDDLFPNSDSAFEDDLFPDSKSDFSSFLTSPPPPSTSTSETSTNQRVPESKSVAMTTTPPPISTTTPSISHEFTHNGDGDNGFLRELGGSRQEEETHTNGFMSELQQHDTTLTTTTTMNDSAMQWQPQQQEQQQQQQQLNHFAMPQTVNQPQFHVPPRTTEHQAWSGTNSHQQTAAPSIQSGPPTQFYRPPTHSVSESFDDNPFMKELSDNSHTAPPQQHQLNRAMSPPRTISAPPTQQTNQQNGWQPSPQPRWSPVSNPSPSPNNQWQQSQVHSTNTGHWQPPPSNWQQQSTVQQPLPERWTPSPSINNKLPNNGWRSQTPTTNWSSWNQNNTQEDFFNRDMHNNGHQQSQYHQMQQSAPPRLSLFSFGFGKTVFIPMNSTTVQISTGMQCVATQKPDLVATLDITDSNSRSNYLDFTLNSILSNASKEKWELWQAVQLFARNSGDRKLLIDQISQFLLSHAAPQIQSPQFQVYYNEAAVIPHLERGDVRAAIDEAMNNGMYGIAILLSQGWPELGLYEQVLQAVANTASPLLSSMLGFNNQSSDWRRTVALVLRNNSKAKAPALIQSLGDKLWKDEMNVYSAHLCYLCCSLLEEKNDVLTQRTILLGGDHKRNLKGFFDKETIERSMFISEMFNSPKFQPFKLVYALYLISYCGDLELAQKYLSSIPANMIYNQQFKYQHELLLHRLKSTTGKSGFFGGGSGGSRGSVTGWLFKSFENLIHGDEANSPTTSEPQQQQQIPPSQRVNSPPNVQHDLQRQQYQQQQQHMMHQQQQQQAQPESQETLKQQSSEKKSADSGKSWFGSLFGKKKNEVSLGKDLEMEFCSARKRWVPKGQAGKLSEDELREEQAKSAPPPMLMTQNPSFLAPQASITSRGGYIDLFNSGSSGAPPTSTSLPKIRSTPNMSVPPPTNFFIPQANNDAYTSGTVSEPTSPNNANSMNNNHNHNNNNFTQQQQPPLAFAFKPQQ